MKLWSEWQELERSTLRALRDRNPRWLRKLAKAIQRNPQTAELVVRSLARKGLAEYDGDGFGRGVVRLTEKGRREARTL
jgi:Mn-dependent DtxR family transcriptional regulator